MKMFPADIWEYPIPKVGNFSFRFLGKTLDEIHRVPKWMLYDQVPDESWYDVYDIALLHILKELPPEDKIIHVAAISNNWAIRHPEKKLHGTFAGRILEYLRAFRELSIK